MLSELNYEELLPYRNGSIGFEGNPTERMQYLIDKRYIDSVESKTTYLSECDIVISTIKWGITESGKDALEEFEQSRQENAEEKSQKKKDRAFEVCLVVLGALLGIIADNVFGIAEFVKSLFIH